MIKQRLIFLILILQLAVLGLASCTLDEQPTPTPFPGSGSSNPITRTSNEIIPVDLVDLAASPELYEGAYLKVNGRYRRLPTRVCSNEAYPSPVAWGLAAGELIAYMNGLDAQLRSLIPDETTMVVGGIWRRWQGPVGCGKGATVQHLWYLEVREIISPNPLTQITLTPTHPTNGTQIASANDGTSSNSADETPNPNQEETAVSVPIGSDESTPIPTNTPSSNDESNLPTSTQTITAVSTEVDDDDGDDDDEEDNSSSTATPTSSSATNNTATPVSTSSGGGGGTAVPTSPSLSTPTPVPQEIEIDELETIQSAYALIDNAEIHVWTLDLIANSVITVSAASQPGLNLALSLIDPTGQIIVDQQDLSSAGSIETIESVPITMNGNYELHIQTTENSMGDYVLSFYDDSNFSYPFIYQDVWEYGDSASAILIEAGEDSWHFYGNSGDNITIILTPDDSSAEMALWLFDEITGLVEEGQGLSSGTDYIQAMTVTLSDNGMYSIQLFDLDFGEQAYTLSLVKNN